MASEHDVAFPTLSDKDLAALAIRGHPREIHTGELLFEEGDRNLSFFVLQEGAVEILEHSGGTEHSVVVHHQGQFTGDVDVLMQGRGGRGGWRGELRRPGHRFLSRYTRRVHVVLRKQDLGASMSRYLVNRVEGMENVTIHRGSVVTGLEGNGHLSAVHVRNGKGEQLTFQTNSLYLFIGADPNTSWLHGCAELDKNGFVLTGVSLPPAVADAERWHVAGRAPFLLETSLPGVFAAGDVRAGSAKRVSSAVGEAAMAVSFVHAHIARPV